MGAFTDSPAFTACVHAVFTKVDTDKSGAIDKEELLVALCHLHYTLKSKSPGVTEAPTTEKLKELLKENDLDGSGTLTEDEFGRLAKKWYTRDGGAFVRGLIVTSFISMVVLPESAALLHREVPIAKLIPKAIFKVLFGIVFKIVATNLPSRA